MSGRDNARAKESTIENDTHNAHVTEIEIMRYLDGTLGERDNARVRSHIRECNRCFDECQDSAVVHGIWLTDKSAFESTAESVNLGMRAVPQPVPDERTERAGGPSRPSSRFQRRQRLVLATASAVAVLIVGLWWLRPGGIDSGSGTGLDPAVVAPVQRAIETAAIRGPFVLPGAERSLDRDPSVYRSGFVPLSDSLSWSLEQLQEEFQKGQPTADLACLLMGGYIATGQRDAARNLAAHPGLSLDDWRVTTLQALVAYMDGNHEESEVLLRGVLESDPNNPVAAINLAVILDEQGDSALARTILTRVSETHADTPVARKAQSILLKLDHK